MTVITINPDIPRHEAHVIVEPDGNVIFARPFDERAAAIDVLPAGRATPIRDKRVKETVGGIQAWVVASRVVWPDEGDEAPAAPEKQDDAQRGILAALVGILRAILRALGGKA